MCVDFSAVKQGQGAVFGFEQQADFGAAQNHALGTLRAQIFNHIQIISLGLGFKAAEAQFIKITRWISARCVSDGTKVRTPCRCIRRL